MFALWVALLAAIWLSSFEGAEAANYTIHSTVIFARTGDRTPLLVPGESPYLTNLGAQQMYNLGAYFRRRYITSGDQNPVVGASVLNGLSSWRIDNDQVFVEALDDQYTASSAQAFMQAFYPPYNLTNTTAESLDPSSLLADGSYVYAPMAGYQYATINTVSTLDPSSIYLSGSTNCDYFELSANEYYLSADFNKTEGRTRTMYQSIGHAVLDGVMADSEWSFEFAYLIFDYVAYQNMHNATAKEILDGPGYRDNIDQLGALASEKQWDIYANLSASGQFVGDKIRAIAGQTLAASVLGSLISNIGSQGTQSKVNLLVGEYPPMLSLFSLMDLPNTDSNSNFQYIPPFASAFAFELFSWENDTGVSDGDGINYPDPDNLWVRFLYINGSLTDENPNPSIQAYPLFDRGPSQSDMRWTDFEQLMSQIMLADVADWCLLCGASAIFCPAFINGSGGSGTGSGSRKRESDMTPQVAGVIGAAVTLGVIGIGFALAMIFGGIRFQRRDRGKKSELGGFKGSSKLASDPDLHLPKNAAPIGIVAVEEDGLKKGHERVGSWELQNGKEVERNTFTSLGGSTVGSEGVKKPSFEMDEDRDAINPFEAPVNPRESV